MISLIRAAWQEEMRVPMFVGLSTDGYPDSDDPAMKNGARCYHMDTGAEYEYSVDDDAWYPVPSGSGDLSAYAEKAWVEAKEYQTAQQVTDAITLAIGNAIGGSY